MKKVFAAIHLFFTFVWALIMSGVDTFKVVMQRGAGEGNLPPAQLVRMQFAPMSAWGATLLANMITLTPGTTTIDIDMDKHELLMHVLNAADVEGVIQGVRDTFEPDLVVLFGDKP
ncbi:MAG: Na+/H+ antiporter subunit E [Brachymonas sp.]|nr:Na+/H+ antiporter subunit E [Brachymonas sp.]